MFHNLWRRLRMARSRPPNRRFSPEVLLLEDRQVPTVSIFNSFQGLDFTQSGGSVPPDTHMAVGPNHVVETVNTTLAIYSRSGGSLAMQTSLNGFFAAVSPGPFVFDPVVIYDELANRFVLAVLDVNDTDQSAFVEVAVSNSADPTQGFTEMQKINVREFSASLNANLWGDYPKLGYNADAYVITLNMFSFPTNSGSFDHVQVVSLDKSTLLDGNPNTLRGVRFDRTDDFTMAVASMHGARTGDPMWFVESGGGSTVRVVQMSNVLSTSATFTNFDISVASYRQPPKARQPGTGQLDTGDTRMLSVEWRSDRLLATHTVGLPSDSVAHVRFYEFDTTGNSAALTQQGTLSRGSGVHTWSPAIALAADGTVGLTYIESSPTEFLSMYATAQATSDPRGTLESPVLIRGGQASYTAFDGSPFRSGDYSGIGVDPVMGLSFWAANEFATSTSRNNWGTWIANFGTGTLMLTANQRFVAQAYLDLLKRPVDGGGLAFWTDLLARGGTRVQVVQGIEASQEYRRVVVDGLYQRYLRRPADPPGLTAFTRFLAMGGTDEQVAAQLLGSPEYFQNRAGGTNDGFLSTLYLDVLKRPIDATGQMVFGRALANGATPAQVATAILGSAEYFQGLVQGFFQQFLRRTADTGGLNRFTNALLQGARDEDIIANIVGSNEYFGRLG